MLPTCVSKYTTITSDPGILCFHHCDVKVFCFNLPRTCPSCQTELDTDGDAGSRTASPPTTNLLLPFRLPYPFVRASQHPCAIVLRPTTGDFLNDYNNSTDLHIAVTTSSGCVVEFDRNGLQRRRTDNTDEWWQCLLVGDVPEHWYDVWDSVLFQICKQHFLWTVESYQEDSHNCYTFVLAFLQSLGYDKLSEAAQNKTTFCEKYIIPRTTIAGKYISLYRKLRDGGIYVHPDLPTRQNHIVGEKQKRNQQRKRPSCHMKTSVNIAMSTASSTGGSLSTANSNSIFTRASTLCTIEE